MHFLSTILALSTAISTSLVPVNSEATDSKVLLSSALPTNVVKPANVDSASQVLSDFDKAVEQRERRKKYNPTKDSQVVESTQKEDKILILGGPEVFPM